MQSSLAPRCEMKPGHNFNYLRAQTLDSAATWLNIEPHDHERQGYRGIFGSVGVMLAHRLGIRMPQQSGVLDFFKTQCPHMPVVASRRGPSYTKSSLMLVGAGRM